MFDRFARWATVAAAVVVASGCALQAPAYQPSLDNVELAKKFPGPATPGTFTVQAGGPGVTSVGLRGSSMTSPVGSDYAAYLADALRKELELAGKLDSRSKVVVTGVLQKNDIAAGGFSTNSGEIEAQFAVLRDGKETYRATHRVALEWESSFVGGIAIPKAQQQYAVLVQKLIGQLFSDARFVEALK